MKSIKQKAVALAMAAAMTLSRSSAAFAADFPDMPAKNSWSYEALEAAVDNGLLNGRDGLLTPGGLLTRAEMAAIVVRSFGATDTASLSAFTDVDQDAWYCGEMSSAYRMGVLTGDNGAMAPGRPITRQEAFTVLARALMLEEGDFADLERFRDASAVAAWAVGPMAAMVKGGYVSGANGALNPRNNITRAEFAQVMHNIFGQYITKAGIYGGIASTGNVMVNASGVTITNVNLSGDVVVGDGVGEGDVYFENVSIDGRVVVRGGGSSSIHFINSKAVQVVVSKVQGGVRVVADEESTITKASVVSGEKSVILEGPGGIGTLSVDSGSTPVEVKDAKVGTITTAAGAEVTISGASAVTTLRVGVEAAVSVADTAVVSSIEVPASSGRATIITVADTAHVGVVKADGNVVLDGKADRVVVSSEAVSVTTPGGGKVAAEVAGNPGDAGSDDGSIAGGGAGMSSEKKCSCLTAGCACILEEDGRLNSICAACSAEDADCTCKAASGALCVQGHTVYDQGGITQNSGQHTYVCAVCGLSQTEDCTNVGGAAGSACGVCGWEKPAAGGETAENHTPVWQYAANANGTHEKTCVFSGCTISSHTLSQVSCVYDQANNACLCGNAKPHEHSYVNGVCICGDESAHSWDGGACGAANHSGCVCPIADGHGDILKGEACGVCKLPGSREAASHEHSYVNGLCLCGAESGHNWSGGACIAQLHSQCVCPIADGHGTILKGDSCGVCGCAGVKEDHAEPFYCLGCGICEVSAEGAPCVNCTMADCSCGGVSEDAG